MMIFLTILDTPSQPWQLYSRVNTPDGPKDIIIHADTFDELGNAFIALVNAAHAARAKIAMTSEKWPLGWPK
jgi:hypothetical protein